MPESDQRPKVTIEDLLHLKRAERPADEFWGSFERELRQKQLTALLEKRPWWQEIPQMLARRAYLPVGATAVLAFTLVSVKYLAPGQVAQVEEPAATDSAVAVNHEGAVAPTPASSPFVNRSAAVPAAVQMVQAAPEAAAAENSSSEAVELMPLLVVPREVERPSARLLAANPSRLEQTNTDFGQTVLGNQLSEPAVVRRVASASDELASVPTNNARRHRLLARYNDRQYEPEPAPPAVVRERLARRLGDTETSERSSRFARDINSFGTPMPQIVALRF